MAICGRSKNWCSALNCHNGSAKYPRLSFYRFPKDKERCAKWIQNTRRIDLLQKTPEYMYANCRLCSEHFEDSQILNTGRLVWNAIPTLFRMPNLPKMKQKLPVRCENNGNNLLIKTIPKIKPVMLKAALGELETHHTYALFSNSKLAEGEPTSMTKRDYKVPMEIVKVDQPTEPEESPLKGTKSLFHTCTSHAQSSIDTDEIQRLRDKVNELQASLDKKKMPNCSCTSSSSYQKVQIQRLRTKVKELQMNLMKGQNKTQTNYTSTERVKMHRLRKKVKELQERLKEKKKDTTSVKYIIDAAGKYLSGTSLQLFASQLRIAKRHAQGRRYTQEDKLLAWKLHHKNPSAYNFCREIFALPTERSLRRVNIVPEVTYTTFDELSSAYVEEVVCSVINEMSFTSSGETII